MASCLGYLLASSRPVLFDIIDGLPSSAFLPPFLLALDPLPHLRGPDLPASPSLVPSTSAILRSRTSLRQPFPTRFDVCDTSCPLLRRGLPLIAADFYLPQCNVIEASPGVSIVSTIVSPYIKRSRGERLASPCFLYHALFLQSGLMTKQREK